MSVSLIPLSDIDTHTHKKNYTESTAMSLLTFSNTRQTHVTLNPYTTYINTHGDQNTEDITSTLKNKPF